ncbi:M1 family metallopeptidase [Sphingomonas sp. H39-1-10]|uniref:M1 family metallopeptidase n=1 Tax=Sphingomonas pollutisoli TaxID=3030829 RepID=UPI0023B98576|nr:M1 family metallopeptidase [Sphingomonas pollutisoli]MDF0489772.1 M1 family metallopeptidase [Sphingomonas pollutisoli]
MIPTLIALAAAPLAAPAAAPATILTTPEAKDTLSFAEPEKARVTHVDLDLTADFTTQRLRGTATLDILAKPGVGTIVLDDDGLVIARITDAKGRALKYTVGAVVPDKGAPLTVAIGDARRIVVTYTSAPKASALQWLPPSLTAGKTKPFLFSQGEPTNNRSWIPTQDSPGIRQSWSAHLTVPADMIAVMSANRLTPKGEPAANGRKRFAFDMPHAVPPYLIAFAVGDLAFKPLGPTTGVYAEPATLARAAAELDDTEKMVAAASALYGPYRWGRYDILMLPPSFPYGGMENPTLTFATPTILTGDKSNVDVIAHELAHSWSGNLVTNATWSDAWLNEGFTTYFENRIDEAVYGKERAATLADLSWDNLQRDLTAAGAESGATRLHGDPGGTYGELDYNKGATFLRTIEYRVGRARWDAYLRGYFDRHAFQPQTTAGFLADLRANLIKGDAALEKDLELDRWAYQPGLPDNAVHVRSATLAAIDTKITAFAGGAAASSIDTAKWSTQEWLRFLNGLPRQQTAARLAEMDSAWGLSKSPSAYIGFAWFSLAIANHYDPVVPALDHYLHTIGRGLFVYPLYRALMAQGPWGQPIARRIYASARATYHPTVAATLDGVVK